jgi:hypothetical protein
VLTSAIRSHWPAELSALQPETGRKQLGPLRAVPGQGSPAADRLGLASGHMSPSRFVGILPVLCGKSGMSSYKRSLGGGVASANRAGRVYLAHNGENDPPRPLLERSSMGVRRIQDVNRPWGEPEAHRYPAQHSCLGSFHSPGPPLGALSHFWEHSGSTMVLAGREWTVCEPGLAL